MSFKDNKSSTLAHLVRQVIIIVLSVVYQAVNESLNPHDQNCMNVTEYELKPLRKKKTPQPKKEKPKMADTTPKTAVLEPGKVIRPQIDEEGVKLLAERLYGISVLELTELNGYDDRNFKITEDPNIKNPLITNHCEHGYVLKIMNSMDSQNLSLVEAQNEIMNFLTARSVRCPRPIRNVYGHLHSLERIGESTHAVRLLEFVPGELLKDVPPRESLFYQVGQFVATLDNTLQNFNHSGVLNREHIWMLSKVPDLDKFKFVIKDAEKLDLVEEVIEEYKYAVKPRLSELQRGVIHGDFNEMNILVGKQVGEGGKSGYRISGILDFGDIQYSYYVFELAITMTYMMLIGGNPKVGGLVLAGYTLNRRLPDEEYMLLKTLISARLVQSLVLGAYSAQQDPSNTYVQSTEKANGWQLLKDIRKTKYNPEEGDPTDWKTIANEYLTKS